MKFRPIENSDINENIIGKWIKDSNEEIAVKVTNFYEDVDFPQHNVSWKNEYLNYGKGTDEYMLLRNFEIEV